MVYEILFDNKVSLSECESHYDQLKNIPAKPGVSLLTAGDKPVLLLYGTNLRAIVTRRLDGPEPGQKSRKADLRPLITSIYYKLSYSRFQTQLDFFNSAKEIYPKSWQKLFPKLNAWFIYLDLSGYVPVLKVTDKFQNNQELWGPFATKSNADRMLESLTVIFKLCRCTKNLQNSPNSTPCSYSQMNLCSMACNGSTRIEDYNQIILKAVDFLNYPVTNTIEKLKTEIKQLSANLEFEKAEKLSRLIDECKKVSGKAFRWVGPMSRFRIACFQVGPKIAVEGQKSSETGIIPFLILPNGIIKMQAYPLSAREQCSRDILDMLQKDNHTEPFFIDQYLLAWVCQILYKSDKQKGLFLRLDKDSCADNIADEITAYFGNA